MQTRNITDIGRYVTVSSFKQIIIIIIIINMATPSVRNYVQKEAENKLNTENVNREIQ
jgi:hypothetical protein